MTSRSLTIPASSSPRRTTIAPTLCSWSRSTSSRMVASGRMFRTSVPLRLITSKIFIPQDSPCRRSHQGLVLGWARGRGSAPVEVVPPGVVHRGGAAVEQHLPGALLDRADEPELLGEFAIGGERRKQAVILPAGEHPRHRVLIAQTEFLPRRFHPGEIGAEGGAGEVERHRAGLRQAPSV